MRKPILCLDFDGVIHSYASGWRGADVIPDPPVAGAMEFIIGAVDQFRVAIFSSRSNQEGGMDAMQFWLKSHLFGHVPVTRTAEQLDAIYDAIEWPTEKPPAMVSIDDRALTFTGEWPDLETLKAFKPWNKNGV